MTGSLSDDTAQGPDTDDAVLRKCCCHFACGYMCSGKGKGMPQTVLRNKEKRVGKQEFDFGLGQGAVRDGVLGRSKSFL